MKTEDGKQLRPCIVSWAKVALKINENANNSNKCTPEYWEKVIDIILAQKKFKDKKINRQIAIDSYHLVNNKKG
ncbi:hypothetical protein EQG63_11250 [Flavobacterium amnicola]|uniref:Uncharacterized protein n=1 Tax=Flavobacterium amnicola TaxID=2506422 RepID=A0A4Q1K0K7_9FLAO|nr:hypothetical protein [Flavobacterium amnicola]RXR17357.1 hypothetical protein EQG63_11250 [Flavobacterium amnicola]